LRCGDSSGRNPAMLPQARAGEERARRRRCRE
jgi:hypothetical protein